MVTQSSLCPRHNDTMPTKDYHISFFQTSFIFSSYCWLVSWIYPSYTNFQQLFKHSKKNLYKEDHVCPPMPNDELTQLVDNDKHALIPFNLANMMPIIPNTSDNFITKLLSTRRVASSIPKSNTGTVWEYPSSLQFYKAMKLRNKEPDPESIDAVVSVHNTINERTWTQILNWERMHLKQCSTPILTSFVGRPNNLTMKARWKSTFTHLGRPFDRHDWIIDRCGTQVKYIIDYYDDCQKNDDLQITIDTRPAPNTFQNIYDILRHPIYHWMITKRKSE